MENKIIIYGLRDPRSGELRYVGKTTRERMLRRLAEHGCMSTIKSNTPRNRWLLSLLRLNIKPEMCVIEETTEILWEARERFWISHYRSQGARLTNTTDGGDGGATCRGAKWTDGRRKAFTQATKGHAVSEKVLAVAKQHIHKAIEARKIKFDDEQLAELYVNQRLSFTAIGRLLGVTYKPVARRVKELRLFQLPVEKPLDIEPKPYRRGRKLSESTVREIRTLISQSVPYPEIARRFGVNTSCICHINKGRAWKWVQ